MEPRCTGAQRPRSLLQRLCTTLQARCADAHPAILLREPSCTILHSPRAAVRELRTACRGLRTIVHRLRTIVQGPNTLGQRRAKRPERTAVTFSPLARIPD